MITAPGLYPDIAESAYYADPCPSPSFTPSLAQTLMDFSPLHTRYEHPRLETPEEDETEEKYVKATAIGNAAHKLVIGRGREIAVADFDSWRGKKAEEAKTAALECGKLPILSKHMDIAERMVKALNRQLRYHEASDAFRDGHGEIMLAWQEDGYWFRTLIDWLHDGYRLVDDLKTGGVSASPNAIPNRMVDAGWDVRAAFIDRGLNVLFPDDAGRRRYRFIAQENWAPFALTVNELPRSVMTMGEKKVEHAIGIWKRCMAMDNWPAYPLTINHPSYPEWKEKQWLDREIEHHENTMRRREPMLTDLSGG